MKRYLITVAVLWSVCPAMADITFYFTNGSQVQQFTSTGSISLSSLPGGSNGGAFSVNLKSGTLSGSAYSEVATVNNLFSTFCVESAIHVEFGKTYVATVDPLAFKGGGGAVWGDPISDVTENIYTNWLLQSDLGAQNLGFADKADMLTHQADISKAIWWAEGESNGSKNDVAKRALLALGYGESWSNVADFKNATCVAALNLWTVSDHPCTKIIGNQEYTGYWATDIQTQLVKTCAVPAPTAAWLGVLGLGILGYVKHRRPALLNNR